MKTHTLTATFDDNDYRAIRVAAMRGELTARFTRTGDQVTFKIRDLRQFCRQISSAVDFGATSAAEVFGIVDLLRLEREVMRFQTIVAAREAKRGMRRVSLPKRNVDRFVN